MSHTAEAGWFPMVSSVGNFSSFYHQRNQWAAKHSGPTADFTMLCPICIHVHKHQLFSSLSTLSLPPPSELGIHTGFCGCMGARCQPRPQWWVPTIMYTLGTSPQTLQLYTISLTSITSLYCGTHTHGKILLVQGAYQHSRPSQLLVCPDSALSPVIGLQHQFHLQLAPLGVHIHAFGSTLNIGLHWPVPVERPCSHGTAHQHLRPHSYSLAYLRASILSLPSLTGSPIAGPSIYAPATLQHSSCHKPPLQSVNPRQDPQPHVCTQSALAFIATIAPAVGHSSC